MPNVKRLRDKFMCDSSRVITRFFSLGDETRTRGLITRILTMAPDSMERTLQSVLKGFASRHRDIRSVLFDNYEQVSGYVNDSYRLSMNQKLLLGAYFTSEYSVESAALFNPSIVVHPNQDGIGSGCLRFILTLRAVGEGHISSMVFRSGILDKNNSVVLDSVSPYVERAQVEVNPSYDRHTFLLKLEELGASNSFVQSVFASLPDSFSLRQLHESMENVRLEEPSSLILRESMEIIDWIAESNYMASFSPQTTLSERVIFPVAHHESKGMEDARFVRFTDENDEMRYFATYTASDGHNILPMLLHTEDFLSFSMRTLNGVAIRNKGLALFPRRVNGKYMMVSRQDGENMYIMESDNIDFWHEATVLQRPEFEWELVQIGNCGSPIETKAGWLLLTHGVGPLRQYCISATLLDLATPSKVIGRLVEPLIAPREQERDGYVPNVVYSCGALVHADSLVIPYAMSDTSAGIATVPLGPLLKRITERPSDNRRLR